MQQRTYLYLSPLLGRRTTLVPRRRQNVVRQTLKALLINEGLDTMDLLMSQVRQRRLLVHLMVCRIDELRPNSPDKDLMCVPSCGQDGGSSYVFREAVPTRFNHLVVRHSFNLAPGARGLHAVLLAGAGWGRHTCFGKLYLHIFTT